MTGHPKSEAADFIRQNDGLAAELDELHALRIRVTELELALTLSDHECGKASKRSAEQQQYFLELWARLEAVTAERDELQGKLRLANADADEYAETIGGLLRELSDLRKEHAGALQHLHIAKMMLAKARSLRAEAGQGGVETRRGW